MERLQSRQVRGNGHGMVEALETRRLLAGNVTAVLDGGTLVITGDNKSNDVLVVMDANTHVVAVPGTTVNGGTANVDFGGLPDLAISTGNGEDTVDVVDPLDQNISINTGNGQDSVSVRTVNFDSSTDDLTINTGNGNDSVLLQDSLANVLDIHGDLNINTGNGSDDITFVGVVGVFGDATIDGGHGPDTLNDDGLLFVLGTRTDLNIETTI